eukprot:scpid23034/ scgid33925/ 
MSANPALLVSMALRWPRPGYKCTGNTTGCAGQSTKDNHYSKRARRESVCPKLPNQLFRVSTNVPCLVCAEQQRKEHKEVENQSNAAITEGSPNVQTTTKPGAFTMSTDGICTADAAIRAEGRGYETREQNAFRLQHQLKQMKSCKVAQGSLK